MQLIIDNIGGNCPVQAEGTINGRPFYFRARGAAWSFAVGDDPIGNPEWCRVAKYGVWPDAGWMSVGVAMMFIEASAASYCLGEAA